MKEMGRQRGQREGNKFDVKQEGRKKKEEERKHEQTTTGSKQKEGREYEKEGRRTKMEEYQKNKWKESTRSFTF